ncbi:hypothetical protein FM038_023780 [Shewanella eurypsychrophilus]|uniref:Uncharacterized protein n=1 Tax=Shewanella eurypsychrophilus TaxID=2593656 RepID=A0ABX6VBZ2_9GAMM|nr:MULTISPECIES: hypothetical protein [Shewanella]QFU24851.1 hypothetical protein FS418_25435 [Shewanella sp. YLB-09]QPG60039.1 hypothetical protein FM038_023780 [Shewanella eurypsychrophilus]
MKKISSAVLLSAGILFSTASIASMNGIVECNDCSQTRSQLTANEFKGENVFVVDFVNRTAQKYIVEGKDTAQLTSMTLGELNRINQKYDYRKAHLRAVKP